MSRYIDADKIEYKHIVVFLEREDEHGVYKSEIDAMPTTDVKPVVRGEWIEHDGYSECSLCGRLYTLESNYCQNCGADMRGGR